MRPNCHCVAFRTPLQFESRLNGTPKRIDTNAPRELNTFGLAAIVIQRVWLGRVTLYECASNGSSYANMPLMFCLLPKVFWSKQSVNDCPHIWICKRHQLECLGVGGGRLSSVSWFQCYQKTIWPTSMSLGSHESGLYLVMVCSPLWCVFFAKKNAGYMRCELCPPLAQSLGRAVGWASPRGDTLRWPTTNAHVQPLLSPGPWKNRNPQGGKTKGCKSMVALATLRPDLRFVNTDSNGHQEATKLHVTLHSKVQTTWSHWIKLMASNTIAGPNNGPKLMQADPNYKALVIWLSQRCTSRFVSDPRPSKVQTHRSTWHQWRSFHFLIHGINDLLVSPPAALTY